MDYPTLVSGIQQLQIAVESHQMMVSSTNQCWSVCMKNARLGTELDRSQKVCFSNCVMRAIDAEGIIGKRVLMHVNQDPKQA